MIKRNPINFLNVNLIGKATCRKKYLFNVICKLFNCRYSYSGSFIIWVSDEYNQQSDNKMNFMFTLNKHQNEQVVDCRI